MRASRVTMFCDHPMIKEPGATSRTPRHQDLNYRPVEGERVCSVWIAFDHVGRSDGAMEFVAGSHRSGRRYRPVDVRHPDAVSTDEPEPLPDVEAHRSEFRILTWELEPGEAVVFSARGVPPEAEKWGASDTGSSRSMPSTIRSPPERSISSRTRRRRKFSESVQHSMTRLSPCPDERTTAACSGRLPQMA